jgi:hypothetical protein
MVGADGHVEESGIATPSWLKLKKRTTRQERDKRVKKKRKKMPGQKRRTLALLCLGGHPMQHLS